jgi:hypothetical protein
MRVQRLLAGVCLASCLAVACGDDDDDSPGGKGGSSGAAGTAAGATAGAHNQGGDGNTGNTGNTGGRAGMPGTAGMPGEGGMAGAEPNLEGFVTFVHDLIENETAETNQPTTVTDRDFPEPKDDHGHYEAPTTAFDDLF